MPILACPFWLALAKETNVDRHRVQSKVYQVRGVARLEADRLALEWSGSVEITEILGANVRNLRQSVPAQRLVLPVSRIADIETRGRWWKPRIDLRTTGLGPVELMPTAVGGRVLLHIARRDWGAAHDLVSHVQLEMADAALRDAERVER
ncbi:MAG: hypothetical protein DMD26_00950 [Gemmatimonadetes bacterium]|nr:MAG: hypothetical protein DMD26_00950 [Gemmatimonadota bacterium]